MSVTAAVGMTAGYLESLHDTSLETISPAQKAKRWFINSYPLLGALAANVFIVEDKDICTRQGISITAINEFVQTIYSNLGFGLSDEALTFVMAHELSHAGLRHSARQQGRDTYLWNVACDFVINAWLYEMGFESQPSLSTLHTPSFKGLSTEEVYDFIIKDTQKLKNFATLHGSVLGDILGKNEGKCSHAPVYLDKFYRCALANELKYHKAGRGLSQPDLKKKYEHCTNRLFHGMRSLQNGLAIFSPPVEKTHRRKTKQTLIKYT